jgi:hypothetical protein
VITTELPPAVAPDKAVHDKSILVLVDVADMNTGVDT